MLRRKGVSSDDPQAMNTPTNVHLPLLPLDLMPIDRKTDALRLHDMERFHLPPSALLHFLIFRYKFGEIIVFLRRWSDTFPAAMLERVFV